MPRNGSLKSTVAVLSAGSGSSPTLRPHTNPGLEIVYVERGHLQWQVEGRVELVPPKSVFFTLPWQRHGSVLEFEPGHRWHFVILGVQKRGSLSRPGPVSFPALVGLDAGLTRRMNRCFRRTHRHAYPATSLMAELLPRLVREFHSLPSTARHAMLSHLCGAALLELSLIIERTHATAQTSSDSDRRVAGLIDQLRQRCDESWTLAAMSRVSGLGRTRLAQVLREQTGESPLRLVNRLRISRACQLLTHSDQRITSIAMACGFATSQHFADVFGRFTGMTPRRYRETHRGTSASKLQHRLE